jgi:hypothetical protein
MTSKAKRRAKLAKRQSRINLQGNQTFYCRQGIAKQVAGPLKGPEEVTQHRKSTALDPGKEQGRAAGSVDPALNGADFKEGVDFYINAL